MLGMETLTRRDNANSPIIQELSGKLSQTQRLDRRKFRNCIQAEPEGLVPPQQLLKVAWRPELLAGVRVAPFCLQAQGGKWSGL